MAKMSELIRALDEGDQGHFEEMVSRAQPYDLATMLLALSAERRLAFISRLPAPRAVEILEYTDPELQYSVLDRLEEDRTSLLLNEMSSDKVVDLLLALHPHRASRLLNYLPADYRQTISELMDFEPETAGSLATVDYISARHLWSVEQTLQHVRKVGRDAEIVSYIYVLDMQGKLMGVVSLKETILAEPGTLLAQMIREEVVSVPAEMHQQEVAGLLAKYDLLAIPVVAHDNRMIGIVTVDDLIDVIHEEATEDIHKLGGSQPLADPYFKNSVWGLFRKRIGWLLILFVAEAYTGNVLRHYEATLSEVIALSFFIPLLIGTGGNAGTQTVTTLVRAMAVGDIKFGDILKVLRKELTTGIMIGGCMGLVAYIRAEFLGVDVQIGQVVAITAVLIVIWASIVSAILPLILHKLKVDPAVVSGPFIATLVDGTGLIIYFTMAGIILGL